MMDLGDLFKDPEMQAALSGLMEEMQDVWQATDPETRNRELLELMAEAIEVGLVVGARAANETPAIWDDIAVRSARMAGLPELILSAIGRGAGT